MGSRPDPLRLDRSAYLELEDGGGFSRVGAPGITMELKTGESILVVDWRKGNQEEMHPSPFDTFRPKSLML